MTYYCEQILLNRLLHSCNKACSAFILTIAAGKFISFFDIFLRQGFFFLAVECCSSLDGLAPTPELGLGLVGFVVNAGKVDVAVSGVVEDGHTGDDEDDGGHVIGSNFVVRLRFSGFFVSLGVTTREEGVDDEAGILVGFEGGSGSSSDSFFITVFTLSFNR